MNDLHQHRGSTAKESTSGIQFRFRLHTLEATMNPIHTGSNPGIFEISSDLGRKREREKQKEKENRKQNKTKEGKSSGKLDQSKIHSEMIQFKQENERIQQSTPPI